MLWKRVAFESGRVPGKSWLKTQDRKLCSCSQLWTLLPWWTRLLFTLRFCCLYFQQHLRTPMRLQHGATSSIASVELHVQSLWDLGTCSKLASPAPVKLVLNLHTCEEAMKSKLRVERRKCRQSWSKSQMLLRRAAALRAVSPRSRWARLCRAQQRTRSGMVPACVVLTSFIAGVASSV